MKHYLTRAQMRELAEIGIDTRQLATHECTENGITYFSLSIGDLIEMLPRTLNGVSGLDIYAPCEDEITDGEKLWVVGYPCQERRRADELIDALFYLVIELNQ